MHCVWLDAHFPFSPFFVALEARLRRAEKVGDEGRRQTPTSEIAAAPHPNPLPARGERG